MEILSADFPWCIIGDMWRIIEYLLKREKEIIAKGWETKSVPASISKVVLPLIVGWISGGALSGQWNELNSKTWPFYVVPFLVVIFIWWVYLEFKIDLEKDEKLRALETPKLEIIFKNEHPFIQDDRFRDAPLSIISQEPSSTTYRQYRVRVKSSPGTTKRGVQIKVSGLRMDGQDVLRGGARHLWLTHDNLTNTDLSQGKAYQKEFVLNGDEDGQMVNVLAIPLEGNPRPQILLFDLVDRWGAWDYRPLEIDLTASAENCPSIKKTFWVRPGEMEQLIFSDAPGQA